MKLKRFLSVLVAAAMTAAVLPAFRAYATPAGADGGMVATSHPLATAAGVAMLKKGGNAVDAAVASAFVLAVVEPQSSGLGGGGFATLHFEPAEAAKLKTKPTAATSEGGGVQTFVDFRETAPAAATRDMFIVEGKPDPQKSLVGGLGVATPGFVAGLHHTQSKYGRLAFREVVAPAAAIAREGFAVDPYLAGRIGEVKGTLAKFPASAKLWLVGGEPLKVGTIVKLPELAALLDRIGKDGPKAFYEGANAAALVKAAKDSGGVLTEADLKAYAPVERAPVVFGYRGDRIVSAPPPSSGGVALGQMLSLYATRVPEPKAGPVSANRLHDLIEAMRVPFIDRAQWLGDPDHYNVPAAGLLDPDYVKSRAALMGGRDRAALSAPLRPGMPPGASSWEIPLPLSTEALARARCGDTYQPVPAPQTTPPPAPGAMPAMPGAMPPMQPPAQPGYPNQGWDPRKSQTTHLSVMDAAGNTVSTTLSVNYVFGGGVTVPGFGYVLNNTMDDFAVAPGQPNAYGLVGAEANAVGPGKRPLSSMSPTIVLRDGHSFAALGSPGGPRIITAVFQVLVRLLDDGSDVQTAVNAPRLHHQWVPDCVSYESALLSEETAAALKVKGHDLAPTREMGNVNAIVRKDGAFFGASDTRRGGTAEGPSKPQK